MLNYVSEWGDSKEDGLHLRTISGGSEDRSGLHSKMIAFIALWRMYRSEPRTDAE